MSRLPLLVSCGLLAGSGLLAGCGASAPASIQAPARVEVTDTTLQKLDAKVLDAGGEVMEGTAFQITGVSDEDILRMGKDGAFQCKSFGTATATLETPPAKLDIVVACMLISEVKPEPAELVLTLKPDASGALQPSVGGPVGFLVLGLDGKPVEGADVKVTVADPSIASLEPDGKLKALKRGRTSVKASVAHKVGTVAVIVGEQVLARQGQPVIDSETLGIPMEAGAYRVSLGSDQPVELSAQGGSCAEHEAGTALDVNCTLDKTGTIVISNPGTLGLGEDAKATFRIIRLP
jgi:hypothetical protein